MIHDREVLFYYRDSAVATKEAEAASSAYGTDAASKEKSSAAVQSCNGMDFSFRVTAETGPDQRDGCSSENKADVASPTFDRFNYKLAQINSTHNGLNQQHQALSPSNSCTDSEAGSSSGSTSSSDNEQHHQQKPLRLKRRLIHDEYNNNDVGAEPKRKCLPEEHDDKQKVEVGEGQGCLGCGACGRQDFTNLAQLDAHIERNHPELPAKCDSCNLAFKNHRALNLHRSMFHYSEYGLANPRELRNSVVGFDDLTFVDFSSDKFPAIARAVCEQSLHRPPQTGETPRYQCAKCLRAFPCRSALDAHEHDCGFVVGQQQQQQQQQVGQRQQLPRTRDDFFAGLDLQNKAALTEAREGKDLADIQSIISVTSSGLHSLSRAEAGTPDNCKIAKQQGNFVGSSGGSTGTPSSEYNPHEEEAQDAFAAEFRRMKLKGEFPCRLCTAIFPNLRALKGHNRAHMGVAPGMPYPCNMCPYSSTDKATLVRHLRSHNGDRPYECSLCNYAFTTKANCERHVRNRHGKLTRDEIKSVLIYHPSEDSTNDGSLDRCVSTSPRVTTTTTTGSATAFVRDEVRKSLVYPDEQLHHLSQLQHYSQQKLNPVDAFPRPSYELTDSKANLVKQQQQADDELDSASSDGTALAKEKEEQLRAEVQANGLTAEAMHAAAAADPKDFYSTTNQLLLTQALLKAGQMGGNQVGSFFANAHMMYRNLSNFPSLLQPYMFNPLFAQELAMKDRMQKELVRGLQTSGGSLVEPPTSPVYGAAFPQQPPQNRHPQVPQPQPQQTPVHQVNGLKAKDKPHHDSSASSVKLRPKNQQSTRGRPPANPPTLLQNLRQPLSQQPAYPSLLPKLGQPQTQPPQLISPEHLLRTNLLQQQQQVKQPAISDQVKYAILAQQLKGNRSEENNESDEELVIDEAKEPSERTLSLLRGKLEATLESRVCVNNEQQQPINATIEIKKEPVVQTALSETAENLSSRVKSECEPDEDEEDDEDEIDNEEEDVKAEVKGEGSTDLASVSEILDNASQNYQQQFPGQYMSDEEGLVASTSDCNQSGSDDCKSDSFNSANSSHSAAALRRKKKLIKKKKKKKSAYSMAPNRVICPYCQRPFPWTSSLRRHILTHTGQKPYQCKYCSLLFTTKSNCDRHLLRKHKANVAKARRNRSTSSPELQQPDTDSVCPTDLLTTTMDVTPDVNDPEPIPVSTGDEIAPAIPVNNNNGQFALRNVPERPYKCNQCPSSTFSTLGNLKKHRSSKHPRPEGDYSQQHKSSRPESPVSDFHTHNSPRQPEQSGPEDCSSAPEPTPTVLNTATEVEEMAHDCTTREQQSGYESHSSGASDSGAADVVGNNPNGLIATVESGSAVGSPAASLIDASCRSRKTSPTASPGPTSETPFKCHLCDSGFAERQDCLDHIKDNHESSYEILVAKGALDMDIDTIDDTPVAPPPPPPQPSDGEERRGRFPDYSNRKVVCAFCMRRFWSAEDLRRHMRTHTGERPFSCDICYRRFTLKHSMLRHRKKHESVDSSMYVGTSGDEDGAPSSTSLNMSNHHQQQQHPTAATPRNHHQSSAAGSGSGVSGSLRASSLPQVADAAPSFNPYDKLSNLTAGISASLTDANDNTDNDLISNLLGIRDKSIIDRVLQASADDAAKLLGVKGNQE
ncbi:hypothetical protein QAD02_023247 [Eretmocerus hayati]|uniref:Uncharacterized protein n=1 Tax=Eretmocerus hayati TaxID=131215 RepID=A0ACC2PWE4_9HYME|nr:hypothetical protein QAD02_023247 [Eretmocerus hayati]